LPYPANEELVKIVIFEMISRFQDSKFQVSGFKFQVSGFRFQVSGFRLILISF
jgi:hypothetical protein